MNTNGTSPYPAQQHRTLRVIGVALVALALSLIAANVAQGSPSTPACPVRYTAEGHRWVENLHGWSAVPQWAKDKHRQSLLCAKSRADGQAMRRQWRRMLRTILPKNHDLWVRIGRCEQPGNGYKGVNWSHPGPTFQGGLGFWHGTWDGFKPSGYPADAGQATWRQQMIVANRLLALYGTSPWGCA